MKLSGKCALVTGAAKGIGAAIVRRLAQDGAAVAFSYHRSKAEAEALRESLHSSGVRMVALAADLGEAGAATRLVRAAHDQLGGLDILVNNAGLSLRRPLPDTDDAAFERLVGVNLRAPFEAMRAAAALMTTGGRIVNIGSTFGARVPVPGVGLYAMTKFGLARLTRGFARDLGRLGITVNAIQPGPIDTDMNPAETREGRLLALMTATGRHGHGADVAAMAAFLASEEAAYITGAVFNVDGGMEA